MQANNIYIGMEVYHEDDYTIVYTVIGINGSTAECRDDSGSITPFAIVELYAVDA